MPGMTMADILFVLETGPEGTYCDRCGLEESDGDFTFTVVDGETVCCLCELDR